jgi:hypothetical protein
VSLLLPAPPAAILDDCTTAPTEYMQPQGIYTTASRDRLLCACVCAALRRSSASPPASNSAAAPAKGPRCHVKGSSGDPAWHQQCPVSSAGICDLQCRQDSFRCWTSSGCTGSPMPLPMHMETMPKRADLPRRAISCSSVAVALAPERMTTPLFTPDQADGIRHAGKNHKGAAECVL